MTAIEALRRRLEQVELELADTRKRLPAHSIKPPIMMALFALEEERDQILEQLAQLPADGDGR
jgi:hypothetical protein